LVSILEFKTFRSGWLRKKNPTVIAYEFVKTFFLQPGHRVPRFSTINFALCVPSSCSNKDTELAVKNYLNELTDGTGLRFKVRVDEEMCQIRDQNWIEKLDTNTKIAG
jgi:hypothetical protein